MERNKRNVKGITLIALVVTIVVLLILAGVSISMLSGENGIIKQAQEAKLETRGGSVEEEVNLWRSEIKLSEYSSAGVKSESDLIKYLKEKGLVFDEEINEEDKIITIGEREIYYGLEANDPKALKFLVNSGDDGIVVLPIDLGDCDVVGGYQIAWGDGTTGKNGITGKDGIVVEQGNKLASTKTIYIGGATDGIPHTYSEKNKEYEITITGICNYINSGYGGCTKEKILEIKQWGETGLESIYLRNCTNLRKIASPSENSFVNITSFNSAFFGVQV